MKVGEHRNGIVSMFSANVEPIRKYISQLMRHFMEWRNAQVSSSSVLTSNGSSISTLSSFDGTQTNRRRMIPLNAQEDEPLFTYDRIVLGCVTFILFLYIAFQLFRILTYRHKKLSFHSITLLLCLFWMLCRICFFIIPDVEFQPAMCFAGFMNLLPIAFGFAAFSLLLTYFAWCFSDKAWDKYIHLLPIQIFTSLFKKKEEVQSQKPIYTPIVTTRPSSFINHEQVTLAEKEYNTETITRRNSSASGAPNVYFTGNSYQSGLYSPDGPIDLLSESVESESRRGWFSIKRKYLWFASFFTINLIWTFFIILVASINCGLAYSEILSNFVVEIHLFDVFPILVACSFCVVVIFLGIYGAMLIYRIRNDDIPMSLKLSNLTTTSVVVVIVLNFLSFTSRVVIDILPLIKPLELDLSTYSLRKTNVGRLFIIFVYLLWEIVPILSVLFFFGKPIPSTSAKYQGRKKRVSGGGRSRLHIQSDQSSHPLDVTSSIIGEFATGSMNNTPGSLVFGSQPRYQHIFDNPRRYDSDDEAIRSLEERGSLRHSDLSSVR